MATSGSQILAYNADPRIGVGSDVNIPVSTTKDLDVVNRVGQQLALANMAQNKDLFEQKVRDRDRLLQAIDSGDIKVGDLLEQDMPYVKQGLDDLDKAWTEMIKGGVNNIDSQVKYKKALREAQDRVTQAQGRKVFYDTESGALSKETLPRKQDARRKNLDTVIKGGFWKDITPYQQTQDLDIPNSILSTASNITTEFTDPKSLTKGKRTVFDYDKTLQANNTNFLNDTNKRYDQQQLLNAVQSLDPQSFKETIDAINNRIKEYNDTKGLEPIDDSYVKEITYQVDPTTGKPMINERVSDFAAKFTLANQKPFVSVESQFDKDAANFQLGKERNRIASANAAANQMRAKAYSDLQKKKLSQLNDDEKRVKGFWDGVVDRIQEQKDKNAHYDVLWRGNLPEGYTYMAGVDKDGKPIKLKPYSISRGGKSIEYYIPAYKLSQTGEDIDKTFLNDKYKTFKDAGGKGDYKTYVQQLIKQGVINLEIKGENGTADFETALQSARALSNKVGSGKEEPVYSETESVQIEE